MLPESSAQLVEMVELYLVIQGLKFILVFTDTNFYNSFQEIKKVQREDHLCIWIWRLLPSFNVKRV